jgi:general stress protein YciG
MGGQGGGFASMSRKRLTEVSAKGGKNADKTKLKHKWSSETASTAGKKGVQKRKQRQAAEANIRLVNMGFKVEDLKALNLSNDEYIYYGGKVAMTKHKRRDELQERINGL